jgi:hypothetical protein
MSSLTSSERRLNNICFPNIEKKIAIVLILKTSGKKNNKYLKSFGHNNGIVAEFRLQN